MIIVKNIIGQIITPRKNLLSAYSTAAAAQLKNFQEEKLKIGDWNINYLKVGQGDHYVLFIPGGFGSIWSDYKPQIEGFDKDQFTLVMLDPPGNGKSRPPFKPAYDFYEKNADCAHEFMKVLQIPKYSVVGWSAGGTTALIHAAKYPESVTKLVGVATKAIQLPHEVDWYKKKADVNKWSERMKKPVLDIYGDSFYEIWAERLTYLERRIKENKGDICSHLLKDIKCPTFILYGGKDYTVDTVHAEIFQKQISNIRLHFYPEGRHYMHLMLAEDFNKRVQEFLLEP